MDGETDCIAGHFVRTPRVILITGFEPFGCHERNASWEAVKPLDDVVIAYTDTPSKESCSVTIKVAQLPVVYSQSSIVLRQLISMYQPIICIHVGVGHAGPIRIEQRACNAGHVQPDNLGQVPPNGKGKCLIDGCDWLNTSVDVEKLAKDLTATTPAEAVVSDDAGQYLCNFTYYESLSLANEKTPVIFIHVCPLNKPYSVDQLTAAVKAIAELLLA